MAQMESHQMPNHQFAMNHPANLGGGCDTKTNWKNYAAVSAMCFPGFDPTSAYSQASALAAATANFMPPYTSVSQSTTPIGSTTILPSSANQLGSTILNPSNQIGSSILNSTNQIGATSLQQDQQKNISSMVQSSNGSPGSPPDSTNNPMATLANVACNPSLNPPPLPPTSNGHIVATTSPSSLIGSQMNSTAVSQLGTSPSSFGPTSAAPFGFPAHSTTPNTPKKKAQPVPSHLKDGTYWERRRRNNESARRSREARRQKEDQISVRVVYLEAENLQLKAEVGMLRNEIDKMRFLLYQSSSHH